MQSGAIGRPVQSTACSAGLERRCQRRRRWHDGNGQLNVLKPWHGAVFLTASHMLTAAPYYLIPTVNPTFAWRFPCYRSGLANLARVSSGVLASQKLRATSLLAYGSALFGGSR